MFPRPGNAFEARQLHFGTRLQRVIRWKLLIRAALRRAFVYGVAAMYAEISALNALRPDIVDINDVEYVGDDDASTTTDNGVGHDDADSEDER